VTVPGRLTRFLRLSARGAGRRAERARRAFKAGRSGLPTDDEGRAKLVCRRYAERRAVAIDDDGRPACYEADHPDCEGCVEDVRDGTVETW
jgi:hypothetical protein